LEKRYCGAKCDEDLCEEGIHALLQKKSAGIYPDLDYLFSGKKIRCRSTCGILYPEMEPVLTDAFDEIDFGLFEGKTFPELEHDPLYIKWMESNGTLPFPEGESREDYIQKTYEGFLGIRSTVLEKESHKETKNPDIPRVGIIAHGGTVMALLSCLSDGDYYGYMSGNGCGFRCIVTEGKDGLFVEPGTIKKIS